MKNTTLIVSTLVGFATLGMSAIASGAVVVLNSRAVWDMLVSAPGASVVTETFNSYNGFYANGLTGNAGGIQWTASAPGNLYAGSGFMSTNSAEALLTFTLSPSVQGVAGNFFATDASFSILPALIGVQLADGSVYLGYAAPDADFVGFYSTGAAIVSIFVSVTGNLPSGTDFVTVDNLYFAFEEYDGDFDGDGTLNSTDNCPTIANPSQADCNTNGIGDACESFIDCNTNTIPDSCDIASGASNDVDSNGIPDECKTDCNGNGLPDAWEISQGTVPDCNLNSIPDSCDLTSGAAADCNNNGVPDSCDITNGAIDKDANGQPDDCQYAHGDFDLSGDIGGGDLGFLLAVWGTNSIIGDLDGDHIIGGGDLGTLLSRWGPVQ